jgi:hypothetical protein
MKDAVTGFKKYADGVGYPSVTRGIFGALILWPMILWMMEIEIMKYDSIGEVNIPGRGLVKVVHITNDEDLPKVNYIVSIDGKKYKVLGVETSMSLMDPPKRNSSVGLLVRKYE